MYNELVSHLTQLFSISTLMSLNVVYVDTLMTRNEIVQYKIVRHTISVAIYSASNISKIIIVMIDITYIKCSRRKCNSSTYIKCSRRKCNSSEPRNTI